MSQLGCRLEIAHSDFGSVLGQIARHRLALTGQPEHNHPHPRPVGQSASIKLPDYPRRASPVCGASAACPPSPPRPPSGPSPRSPFPFAAVRPGRGDAGAVLPFGLSSSSPTRKWWGRTERAGRTWTPAMVPSLSVVVGLTIHSVGFRPYFSGLK